MPVIINEFEVVAEPPAGERPVTAEGQSAAPASIPAPGDIERIMLLLAERLARIAA